MKTAQETRERLEEANRRQEWQKLRGMAYNLLRATDPQEVANGYSPEMVDHRCYAYSVLLRVTSSTKEPEKYMELVDCYRRLALAHGRERSELNAIVCGMEACAKQGKWVSYAELVPERLKLALKLNDDTEKSAAYSSIVTAQQGLKTYQKYSELAAFSRDWWKVVGALPGYNGKLGILEQWVVSLQRSDQPQEVEHIMQISADEAIATRQIAAVRRVRNQWVGALHRQGIERGQAQITIERLFLEKAKSTDDVKLQNECYRDLLSSLWSCSEPTAFHIAEEHIAFAKQHKLKGEEGHTRQRLLWKMIDRHSPGDVEKFEVLRDEQVALLRDNPLHRDLMTLSRVPKWDDPKAREPVTQAQAAAR